MGFLRNISSVLSGALVAQAIPIVGTLVLARVFDSTSFGVFAAWLGVVLFLGVVLTCRFEASLAIEKDGHGRSEAVAFIMLTIVVGSFVAMFLMALAMLMGLELLERLPLSLLIVVIPTAALIAATQTMLNWAAADGRYRHLAILRIGQATSIVSTQITMGLYWPDEFGLAYGYFFGTLVSLMIALFCMPIVKLHRVNVLADLRAYWKKQHRFPMYSLPSDALNTASAQLPVLIIASRFGAEAAGLLAMAIRMLGAPMSLISASVLDVFKRHAGKAYRERGECRKEYIETLRLLIIIAVLSGLAVAFGAQQAFATFFGAEWLGAGTMAVWLFPRFVIGFVASPLSYMVYISGKQHLDLIWQVSLFLVTVLTLCLGRSIEQALTMYGLSYGALYLVYLFMSYKFSYSSTN